MDCSAATGRSQSVPDTRCIAAGLRRFVEERLDAFACSEERHDPKTTARAVGDLTRCLRELVALERALGRVGGAEEDDEDGASDAGMVAGAASRLADDVAREIERFHDRGRDGGDLEALQRAATSLSRGDEPGAGMGDGGAGGSIAADRCT